MREVRDEAELQPNESKSRRWRCLTSALSCTLAARNQLTSKTDLIIMHLFARIQMRAGRRCPLSRLLVHASYRSPSHHQHTRLSHGHLTRDRGSTCEIFLKDCRSIRLIVRNPTLRKTWESFPRFIIFTPFSICHGTPSYFLPISNSLFIFMQRSNTSIVLFAQVFKRLNN